MLLGAVQRERRDLRADLQVRAGPAPRDQEAGFGLMGLIRGAGLGEREVRGGDPLTAGRLFAEPLLQLLPTPR